MGLFNWLGRRRPKSSADSSLVERWDDRPDPLRDAFALVLTPDGQMAAVKAGGSAIADAFPYAGAGGTGGDYGLGMAYTASVWAFTAMNVLANKVAEVLNGATAVNTYTGKPIPNHPYIQGLDLSYAEYHVDYYFDVLMNRLMFGETYTELIKAYASWQPRTMGGVPATLRALPGLAIEPVIDRGQITGYQYLGDDYQITTLPEEAVAYWHSWNPLDTLRGTSTLGAVLSEIGLDLQIVRYSGSYYKNGARPGIIISPKTPGDTFEDSDFDKLRKWLTEKVSGVENAFKPWPFSRAIDVTVVQPPSLEDQRALSEDTRDRILAGFQVPLGMIIWNNAQYQLSPEQRQSFYSERVLPLAKDVLRFHNTVVLPFFDPQRTAKLELDESRVLARVEDKQQRDQMIRDRYQAGQITYNEMRAAIDEPLREQDFVLAPLGARPVPVDKLDAYIDQQMSSGEQVPPMSLQLGAAALPQPSPRPLGGTQPPVPPRLSPGGKSSWGPPDGTVVMYLSDVEQVLLLQQVMQRSLPTDGAIRWTPIDQLHVTLVYAPLVDEGPFRAVFQEVEGSFRGFELTFDEVTTFDSDDDVVPIVLLVQKTDDLAAFQAELVQAFEARSIPLSPYSAPAEWIPHITLGYAPKALVGESALKGGDEHCRADVLAFTRGDYETVEAVGAHEPPQEDQVSELRAWRRVALRRGARKADEFQVYHLAEDVHHEVRRSLQAIASQQLAPDAEKDLVAKTFALAQARLDQLAEPDQVARYRAALRAWQLAGAKAAVDVSALPDALVTYVKTALDVWPTEARAFEDGAYQLEAVYHNHERDWLPAFKAIQATRLDFEGAFEDMLAQARGENMTRRRFGIVLRALLRKFGTQAFRDGLVDGGVDTEALTNEEQASLNAMLAEQSKYVTQFGDVLFHGDGISNLQADQKPILWFNKSIMPLYEAGRLAADANGLYEWQLGRTEEHCNTCLAADTQIHRLSEWHAKNIIPQGDHLECGGWHCDCKFMRRKGKPRGDINSIPLTVTAA